VIIRENKELVSQHGLVLDFSPHSSIHIKKRVGGWDGVNTVDWYLRNVIKVLLSCWDRSAARLSNNLTGQVGQVTLILLKVKVKVSPTTGRRDGPRGSR